MLFCELVTYDDVVRTIAEFLPHRICKDISEVENSLDSGFPYEKIVFEGEQTILTDWLRLLNSKSLKLKSLKELTFRLNTNENFCTKIIQALSNDEYIDLKRLVISAKFVSLHKLRKCLQSSRLSTALSLDATFQVNDFSTVAQLIDSTSNELKNVTCRFTTKGQSIGIPRSKCCFNYYSELGMILRGSKCLQVLHLSRSNLGDREALLLAEAIKSVRCNLVELNLQGNGIGVEGGNAVASSLLTNDMLKRLRLDNNCIGPIGGCSIGSLLHSNRSLREVHLQFNSIGQQGRNAISKALKVNKFIRKCLYYD